MKPYTSRKKKRSLNRLGGRSRSGVKLRVESPDDPERQPNHVVSIDHTHDGTIMHVFKHKEGGYYGDNNKFDFHRDNAKDLHKTLKDSGTFASGVGIPFTKELYNLVLPITSSDLTVRIS